MHPKDLGNYLISMQIGERHLLPSIRQAAKDTLVIADGFSCRTQIAQGSDRHPLRLSELLLLAFDTDPHAPVRSYSELSYVNMHPSILAGSAVALIGSRWVEAYLLPECSVEEYAAPGRVPHITRKE